jgi:hypothetical protein
MSRERSHQIARVGFFTEPTGVIGRREDDRHAVMDLRDQFVRIGGDDGKRPNPFARSGFFPVLPNAGDAERRATLYGNRVRLLSSDP